MAKNVLHFTQARIRDLTIPEKGRVEYYDDEVPKLVCRVSYTGNKSFAAVKWKNGKYQRVTIGSTEEINVNDARKRALEALSQINAGISPTANKRKENLKSTLLEDVLEQYLKERDLKPYTIDNYRYKLKLGFNDWLAKPVSKISEDMILKRHKVLTLKGKTTANTTMRVLRLTLNYALALGMIENNPTSILNKARLWHKNNRKDRVIHSTELKAWHEAVETLENHKAKVYFLMMLYMGFRSSEAITLQWSQVNLKEGLITLHDTKNRSDHTLPIPKPLFDYLEVLRNSNESELWVFPGRDNQKHMDQPRVQMKAVINASGVDFSPHDCRRTFATIAEAVNLPLTMIKRLMNHTTSNDVTGGYIVTEEETLRQAVNKIADYIQSKVKQKGNVVVLKHV